MKYVSRLLLIIALLGLVPGAFAQGRGARWSRTTPVSPARDYVRLWDWARANRFDIRWLRYGKVLELTSRNGNRLTFTSESREATVNGVKVLLSFPIAVNGGAGWISQLDLRAVIQPIFNPQRNARGDKIKTIVLDPGHGGKDPGFQVKSWSEKTYNLLLAMELRDQLNKAGFAVSLTRTTDKYLELPDRTAVANERHADLFISLHFNTVEAGVNEVSGAQVYCFTPAGASSTNARGEGTENRPSTANRNDNKNVLLAYQLQKSLTRNLHADDRGVCRGRLGVLREAQMPAVLIEGGYLSNPVEGRKIVDPAYRRQMAQAIVQGIMDYKNLVER